MTVRSMVCQGCLKRKGSDRSEVVDFGWKGCGAWQVCGVLMALCLGLSAVLMEIQDFVEVDGVR